MCSGSWLLLVGLAAMVVLRLGTMSRSQMVDAFCGAVDGASLYAP